MEFTKIYLTGFVSNQVNQFTKSPSLPTTRVNLSPLERIELSILLEQKLSISIDDRKWSTLVDDGFTIIEIINFLLTNFYHK